jgi:hypothetical protein
MGQQTIQINRVQVFLDKETVKLAEQNGIDINAAVASYLHSLQSQLRPV